MNEETIPLLVKSVTRDTNYRITVTTNRRPTDDEVELLELGLKTIQTEEYAERTFRANAVNRAAREFVNYVIPAFRSAMLTFTGSVELMDGARKKLEALEDALAK